MDGLHRPLAMVTRMELVIKDSQMYRPLVPPVLIILDINKGKVQEPAMALVLAAMEPVVLGRTAVEPVDFRVVWEVDLLAIPEVVVSRVVIFLQEVRVVPVEGFLVIPEVAVPGGQLKEVLLEEGLVVFMEEGVNFLDG